jgi:hypothetical protein
MFPPQGCSLYHFKQGFVHKDWYREVKQWIFTERIQAPYLLWVVKFQAKTMSSY